MKAIAIAAVVATALTLGFLLYRANVTSAKFEFVHHNAMTRDHELLANQIEEVKKIAVDNGKKLDALLKIASSCKVVD